MAPSVALLEALMSLILWYIDFLLVLSFPTKKVDEMKVEGKNAYLEILEDKVEIGPQGWRGFGGQRGVVRVNAEDIKAVELTPPGLMSFGFLKVVAAEGAVQQGAHSYGRKGDLMADPYAVAFAKSDSKKFEEARDNVEKLVKSVKSAVNPPQDLSQDIPAQLEKLASLKESGILTEEEFATKKAELLAKM
jgi:hypothetical protein